MAYGKAFYSTGGGNHNFPFTQCVDPVGKGMPCIGIGALAAGICGQTVTDTGGRLGDFRYIAMGAGYGI